MSFRNPFKAHHAPKKSAISRTAEREFEREVKKLEQLEDNTKNLYRDMRKCIDSQTAQSRCEAKTTQDLLASALVRDDDELRQKVEEWNEATQKLEIVMAELAAMSQKTVVDPMKKFSTIFPAIQSAAKRREQSLQEYTKCQAKVDKYQDRERTGPNIVKLDQNKNRKERDKSSKALMSAREDYVTQNSALMYDMPKLYEGRIEYIQPSFQALIKSQVKYYTECHKLYAELCESLKQPSSDLPTSEYDQNLQQKLADIKSLSIVDD